MAKPPALVLDSTVLINLSKAGLLGKLRRLPEPLLVPPGVYGETVTEGGRLGRPEAAAIQAAVADGTLRMSGEADPAAVRLLEQRHRLRGTDVAVIALAAKHRARVASDDAKIRKVAAMEQVPCGGTGYLLGRLLKERALTPTEVRESLDLMIERGWWITISTYSRLLRELGFDRSPPSE